jgi:hypothetical protein
MENLQVKVRDLVNAIPALNVLLTYKSKEGEPPSLVFGMMVAEIVEAVQPHVNAYNKTTERYRQDCGLTQAEKAFREKYRAQLERGQEVFGEDADALKALMEKFNAENEKLLDSEIQVATGKIAMSLLQEEKIGLTAQHLHALRWLLVRDVDLKFAP